MKNKKLAILLIILAVVIAVVVIVAQIFVVAEASIVYHDFDGSVIAYQEGAPTEESVFATFKGENIFVLDKDAVVNALNEKFPKWYAVAVVKKFPNKVEVHFVERVAVFELNVGINTYKIDSFGYVVAESENELLDISSAFENCVVSCGDVANKLTFADEEANTRLSCIIECISALWQCQVELGDMHTVLGKSNVFTFEDDSLTVLTTTGAKIVVDLPSQNLTSRFIKALGVYYNNSSNLQKNGVVIHVHANGNITTTDK